MAEINNLDFSGCRYDPTSKHFTAEIKEAIPEFQSYKGEYPKRVFTYIVCLYDKNSPLWTKQPEYFQRKVLAAELAKLPKNQTGSFKEETKDILEGKDKKVNILTVAYLANLGDVDYTMLINEMVLFHSLTTKNLGGSFDQNTYKMMQQVSEGLNSRTRKIFGSGEHDELSKIRILLYEKSEKDRQKLNPEAIVKLLDNEGDFPQDWNPYGTKYEVEELKFDQDERQEG
jgi:hypothetical protein